MAARQKSPTITSLARDLQLSTCTVSKILNRSFSGFTYAAETIQRVDAAARKAGYQPNPHARSLRTQRSMSVGFIAPGGEPYFTGALAECIERELRTAGYETLLGHSTADPEQESRLLSTMAGKGVDGLLWIPHGKSIRIESLRMPKQLPVVLLDRPGCASKHPVVMTDNASASRELALRIKEEGYRHATVLTSDAGDDSLVEREGGIRSIFGPRTTRISVENSIEIAAQVLRSHVLALQGKALICLTQNLSLGALSALRSKGMEIGTDLAFASFDSLPLCEFWHPGITRIEQDISSLATKAVDLLVTRIQSPTAPQPHEFRIPATLVWGNTVQRIPASRHQK